MNTENIYFKPAYVVHLLLFKLLAKDEVIQENE